MHRTIIFALLCLIATGNVFAKDIKVKVSMRTKVCPAEASTIDKADEKLKKTAWKKYMKKGFSRSQRKVYRKNKEMFSYDDVFIDEDGELLRESCDEGKKRYKRQKRFTVDVDSVKELIVEASGDSTDEFKGSFGMVFLARVAEGTQEYDARRIEISSSEGEAKVEDSSGSDGTNTVEATGTKKVSRKESGGSTITRRDKITYGLNRAVSKNLAGVIKQQMIEEGFTPGRYASLIKEGAPRMEDVYLNLTDEVTLTEETIEMMLEAAEAVGWRYFGVGTVDIDSAFEDPATGQQRVNARVQCEVFLMEDGLTQTIASVRATQVYGLGPKAKAAETEALNQAAEKALKIITSQLQNAAQ